MQKNETMSMFLKCSKKINSKQTYVNLELKDDQKKKKKIEVWGHWQG